MNPYACKESQKKKKILSQQYLPRNKTNVTPALGCSAQCLGLLAGAEEGRASVRFAQVAPALPRCLELPSSDFPGANSSHPPESSDGSALFSLAEEQQIFPLKFQRLPGGFFLSLQALLEPE